MSKQIHDGHNYLAQAAGRRVSEKFRDSRRKALEATGQISVFITYDGQKVVEEIFQKTPTLRELVARAGADARVVFVKKRDTHTTAARPDVLVNG